MVYVRGNDGSFVCCNDEYVSKSRAHMKLDVWVNATSSAYTCILEYRNVNGMSGELFRCRKRRRPRRSDSSVPSGHDKRQRTV